MLAVKSLLEKLTDCPEILVAGVPMPGQLVDPAGRLATVVVQLLVIPETVKSAGNWIVTLLSVSAPADEGWAQTVPERAELGVGLSSLR